MYDTIIYRSSKNIISQQQKQHYRLDMIDILIDYIRFFLLSLLFFVLFLLTLFFIVVYISLRCVCYDYGQKKKNVTKLKNKQQPRVQTIDLSILFLCLVLPPYFCSIFSGNLYSLSFISGSYFYVAIIYISINNIKEHNISSNCRY